MSSPLALAAASSVSGDDGKVDGTMDLLSFTRASSSSEHLLLSGGPVTSIDCAVVAKQLGGVNLQAQAGGPLVQQQRLAWAWACPLTGNGWARAGV
jgi:hypothetical protein